MRTLLVSTCVVVGVGTATAAPPPAQLTAAADQVGSYRCKGHVVDGDRKRAVSARLVVRLDLDGQWLVWRLTQDRSKTVKRPLGYIIYRSFDVAAATWRSVQLDNAGGRAELASPDGATWTGTLVSGETRVGIRDHQAVVDTPRSAPEIAFHLWGEYEIEPGVFEPGYDVTCVR